MFHKKRAMYLKINRENDYSYYCINQWIMICDMMKCDCIFICDNQNLNYYFLDEMRKRRVIQSGSYEAIAPLIATPRWKNAANAHLTTFYDALEHDYDCFWNIDADDTLFCLNADDMANLLGEVEKTACEKKIDIMSLDMWRTLYGGVTGPLELLSLTA